MRLPKLRTVLLAPVVLFAALYCFAAVKFALFDDPIDIFNEDPAVHRVIAILGASGTAGDGILKAALADDSVDKIHVITRRATPRIDAGVASGKIQMTLHQDYLDFSVLSKQLAEVSVVFWAIGTSTFNVDEETYGKIHVDFPQQFVTEWMQMSDAQELLFHYISSSDISADSSAMWAREKVRAERTLFALAKYSALRVIAYRPDYIGPTEEEAHIGQMLLYWFFAPVKSAVRATAIGEAMLEVTARGGEFQNGDKLSTRKILRYSAAYQGRIANEAVR